MSLLPDPLRGSPTRTLPFSGTAVTSPKRRRSEEGEMAPNVVECKSKTEAPAISPKESTPASATMSPRRRRMSEEEEMTPDTAESLSKREAAAISPKESTPASATTSPRRRNEPGEVTLDSAEKSTPDEGSKKGKDKAKQGKKTSKSDRLAIRLAREKQPSHLEGTNGESFGQIPIQRFQALPLKTRAWTDVKDLVPSMEGQSVLLHAWVQSIKPLGKKLTFLILRDGVYTVQCVVALGAGITKEMVSFAQGIEKESYVEVEGAVNNPTNPISLTSQQVEVSVHKIFCISRAIKDLPFNLEDAARSTEELKEAECRGQQLPHVALDARLNMRILDLRTPANNALFQIESIVSSKFSEFMLSEGFTNIHTPKLTPGVSEGGSSVFEVTYVNGEVASLAQSPQLYKQMAINAGIKKVFEICSIFRAEKSNTHRHLCEYIGLHMEMVIKEHYFEVCDVLGALFVKLFDHLREKCGTLLSIINKQYNSNPLKYHRTTLKLKYVEGIEMLKASGFEINLGDDLSTQAEKRLGQLVHHKYETDFYILYEFPLSVRPFYTMPSDTLGYSNSFDAYIRGEEIVSGSQRIHDRSLLMEHIGRCGIDSKLLEDFIESFSYGAPPRGGFGIGLERVIMLYCSLPNIRQASLFPRDPQRLRP